MKTVGEVTAIVTEWVKGQAGQIPGFAGAYLFGGITHLTQETPFSEYRDVDLIIVIEENGQPAAENWEILHQGIMIEVGFSSTAAHQSAESVAADPGMAPNFASTRILMDPGHFLLPLQQAVIGLYRQRRCAAARCSAEKDVVRQALHSLEQVDSPDWANTLWTLLNNLSGLLALADLRPPTHRRSLTLLKEIVEKYQRLDLQEAALQVWGTVDWSRSDVEALLEETGRIFDRALEVKHSASPFGFKLHPHLRRYFIEASQEMIDEGNPREATFWIIAGYTIAFMALMNDAPQDEKPAIGLASQRWAEKAGWHTSEARAAHLLQAQCLSGEIIALADQILAHNPDLID